MKQNSDNNDKLQKVALTQKLKDTEREFIVNSGTSKKTVLITGHFLTSHFGNGASVQGGNTDELINSMIVSTTEPSLIVTILLRGTLNFGYDDLQFNLDSSQQAQGVIVNLNKPANFKRRIVKHNHVEKLNLIFTPQWLRQRLGHHCHLSQFLTAHKSHMAFKITASILALSKHIISSSSPTSFAESVKLEALSNKMFSEIIDQVSENITRVSPALVSNTSQKKNESKLRNAEKNEKIEEMISYIEAHLTQSLPLEKIADKFAMSISNLQSKFKQQLGLTVNSYVRHRRLEIAKYQLEQGLVSVTEAAYEAGYHHPANFTKAFKKIFGCPPGECQLNKMS